MAGAKAGRDGFADSQSGTSRQRYKSQNVDSHRTSRIFARGGSRRGSLDPKPNARVNIRLDLPDASGPNGPPCPTNRIRSQQREKLRVQGRAGDDFGPAIGADLSIRNTISCSPRSTASSLSPVRPTRWGMSIAASGSVQRTSRRSPGASDFSALRVFSAGSGHFSPDRSSLVTATARHARITRGPSIAKGRRS